MYTAPALLTVHRQALRSGELDLAQLVAQNCERVDAVDPYVKALLPEPGRRLRLLAAAADLERRYPLLDARPPLYGVLVGVKDIIHVDGFVTRGGSSLPPERLAGAEAVCVARLRAAGALVLGKTVTTEFAYFEPGPTRNPHDLLHTPGGSSSGSAAAVAAGLCPLALGTQTIGSVIRPAAFCGVVGFKPSWGRIPTDGVLPFSQTADTVGLFAQDADGMLAAAGVLCDRWRPAEARRRPVLGVPEGPYLEQAEEAALGVFEHSLAILETGGWEVKRVPAFSDIAHLNLLHRRMVFAEFAREHALLYAEFADRYRPRTAEIIAVGQSVSAAELEAAQAHCLVLREELEAQMGAAGIDLWISPAALGAAPEGLHATGDPNMNLPWTHAGLPALTLPAGKSEEGLPLGLQLAGRFGADEELLAWAVELERALREERS